MEQQPAFNLARAPLLVFDWGDTVMQVLPQYSGPMAGWPQVAVVDGTVETLEALNENYQMVIASNAGDSDAPQVWKALNRVGIGAYFRAVFTARELGSLKPDLAFFRQLENVLSRPPHELIMIGDSYQADVLGARQAGWLAAWYNPTRQPAPGLLPLHNLEIADMRQLPAALEQDLLPDYPTCLAWLLETGTPHHILMHVQLVAAIAYQLACWLYQRGEAVQPLLAQRGGLLHDLKKMESVRQRSQPAAAGNQPVDDHARLARDFLLARRQPQLADIADRHMPAGPDHPERLPITWEEKLVHFADKLAEGSRLVSLEERLQALKERYPDFAAELEYSQPYLFGLQANLCARLELSPQTLIARLRQQIGT
jgi:FMN phosphatase YigB (HAD superfamily)